MSGILMSALGNWKVASAAASAALVYNLDAAALGALPGSSIATSASFSGSNNLSVTNSAVLDPGTGDFTIEFWTYLNSTTANASFYRGNNNGVDIFMNGTGKLAMGQAQVATLITDSVTMTTAAWVHVAVVRSSGTTTLYKNGTSVGSAGDSTNYVTDAANYIGSNPGGPYRINGYMSNLRVVIGTAVYTTAFTPPTTTLRAISGTALLLPLTAAPFTDLSANILTVTNTSTVVTAVQAPALTTGTTDVTGTYTITSSTPTATFTGSITGTTLTVSGVTGTITTGMTITGGSVPAGTYIVSGSGSTWTVSASVTQGSTSMTGARINWFGTQGGIFSNYFSGDGIAAFITGGPNIAAATAYTVMMAYKLNVGLTADYGRLLNSNTASPDFIMGGYSNYPKVYFSNGVSINLTGAARDTVWHIDFVTFNGTSLGNVFSSTSVQPTATPTYTATNAGISGFNQLQLYSKSDGNECAAGDIGMVKVWTGVLSTAQMQTEYNAYKARFGY
jgi:hypothetical protein